MLSTVSSNPYSVTHPHPILLAIVTIWSKVFAVDESFRKLTGIGLNFCSSCDGMYHGVQCFSVSAFSRLSEARKDSELVPSSSSPLILSMQRTQFVRSRASWLPYSILFLAYVLRDHGIQQQSCKTSPKWTNLDILRETLGQTKPRA